MRCSADAAIWIVLDWKPEGKRPRGRPRKRWIDVVEKDLEVLGVRNWREIVQDGDRRNDLVMVAKTLGSTLFLEISLFVLLFLLFIFVYNKTSEFIMILIVLNIY